MTEKTIFQRTLAVLGATILAPAVVAVSGGDVSIANRFDDYVRSGNVVAEQQAADTKKDEAAKNDKKDAYNSNKPNETPQQTETAPVGYADGKPAGTYEVKAGDTYGCIAEKYYGSYDQWQKVYDVNAGWPGFDEYRLEVGAKLQMPAVSNAEILPKTNLCQ